MPLCGPIGEVFERDYHWRAWPLLESMELLTPAVDHPATLYSHGCSGGGVLALGVHSSLALRRARDTPIATTSVLNAILTPTLASVLAPACALALLAPILAPAFTQETAEAVAIAASALAVPEPELVRSSSMPISNSSILPSHGHSVTFETGCFVVTLVCTLVIIFAGLSIKHTSLAGKALCRLPFFQMVTVTAMMSGGAGRTRTFLVDLPSRRVIRGAVWCGYICIGVKRPAHFRKVYVCCENLPGIAR